MSKEVEKSNDGTDGKKDIDCLEDPDLPIDRGWAWMILLGCFLNASLAEGYDRSTSLLFVEFLNKFQESATTTTLIIGSKSFAYSLFSLVSMHVVLEFLGTRKTVLLGSTIFSLSILCATFSPNITMLIIVHFVLGIGQSMIQAPGLVLIGQYFKKHRSLATTTASSAVSFSAGVFPLIAEHLLGLYGLTGTMLLLAGMTFNMWVGASLYRPIESFRRNRSTVSEETRPMLDNETTDKDSFEINGTAKESELFKPNSKGMNNKEQKSQQILIKGFSGPSESETYANGKSNNDSNSLGVNREAVLCNSLENVISNEHEMTNHNHTLIIEKGFGSTGIVRTTVRYDDTFRKRSYSEGSKYARRLLDEEKMAYTSNPDMIAVSLLDINEECAPDENMHTKDKSTVLDRFKKILNAFEFSLFKNPIFLLITVISHFAVCARSMSLYIPARVNELGMEQSDAAILLLITGCLDFFCRILYGFLADLKIMRVHHIMALGLFITGLVNEFAAFFTTFPLLIVYSVLTGIFGSAYQCLLPVVIVELMGLKNMAKTLGFTNLYHGLASAITQPIIGGIRDLSGSYVPCFMYLGFTSIVASLLLMCEPVVRRVISRREEA